MWISNNSSSSWTLQLICTLTVFSLFFFLFLFFIWKITNQKKKKNKYLSHFAFVQFHISFLLYSVCAHAVIFYCNLQCVSVTFHFSLSSSSSSSSFVGSISLILYTLPIGFSQSNITLHCIAFAMAVASKKNQKITFN